MKILHLKMKNVEFVSKARIDGIEEGEIIQIFNVNGQLVKEFKIQSNSHQMTIDN